MTLLKAVSQGVLLAQAGPPPLGAPSPAMGWAIFGGVLAVAFFGLLLFLYLSPAGVIARATLKEALRQPVFMLLLGIAITAMVVNTFIPFFTMGDDLKMLKDCGLATLLICGLLLAVWTASTSIADEVEGKTAMTLLSKPINRRQFILGKYIGILMAVAVLLVPVTLVLLGLVDYKVFYDARESSKEAPTQAEAIREVIQTLPGVALIFLEVAVLTAVSVAISTRLPMVVNLVTCLAIFVVGHLTPILVRTQAQGFEVVTFFARLFATVLPALEVFNVQAAVATGTNVPPEYVGWAALYSAAYCVMAILLAFILFEDRDLA